MAWDTEGTRRSEAADGPSWCAAERLAAAVTDPVAKSYTERPE
jgi:hypothetical protein